jgi:hypothetical protein
MNYLYGDSTKSPLKSNFLEFLRDALDFSAFVLRAEHTIRNGRDHVAALRREADAEIGRLEAFVGAVTRTIDDAPKGDPEKTTARTAAHLRALSVDVLASAIESVRQKLASDIAEADAAEAMERAACVGALETLLIPHDPPDARTVTQIARTDGDQCAASLVGESATGLIWQLALAVPSSHAWATPMRVERLVKQLVIRAPQLAGWISKEVKTKPQKLERHIITELVDNDTSVSFKLRTENDAESGFDVEVEGDSVTMVRVGPQAEKEDSSLGPFDVDPEDAPKLVELAEKLRATEEGLERKALVSATFGDAPFGDQDFSVVIERLISMMAPITREISDRSLMPNELVIRRLLGGDRREEIFVTKASLREKYATLPGQFAALFAPLGLDAAAPRKKSEAPPENAVVVRSELPKSIPPPAKSERPPAMQIPPPPTLPTEAGNGAPKRNEAIVARVKRAIGLAKKGNVDEAYKEYESLFTSDEFANARPEDQRQALKLMVMGKFPTPLPEQVVEALLAAILRLQKLVELHREPVDFEMLGVGYQLIDDNDAATRVFNEGLEIERARNPGSELCGRLATRATVIEPG